MRYIVEYATYTFEFNNRGKALSLAELMAESQHKYSPWVPKIKVVADEEDKNDA